jgi:23S rRNA (cytidine1920-2'-O)/16S rRNA (cytidine1409-2'-O)-methyltransferase
MAFVSRGGLKLAAALDAFVIGVEGLVCCDLGSHVGGFVDCLLQRGAARVVAVEPGYGVLDYKLRRDPRVEVRERTNALHFLPDERFDLVTIDVGWTPHRLILPAARRLLKPDARGVISLVKPHYEAPKEWVTKGVLAAERRGEVLAHVDAEVRQMGWSVRGVCESPISGHAGNSEQLWWLTLVQS